MYQPSKTMLIFDCDGTLANSQYQIYDGICAAFAAIGLPCPSPACVRKIIGLSLDEALEKLCPDIDVQSRQKMAQAFSRSMHKARLTRGAEPLYPGIKEALSNLHEKGYHMSVATGKSQQGLDMLVKVHKLQGYFHALNTASHFPSKPDPAMAIACLEGLEDDIDYMIVIGDTSYDMSMAINADMLAMGVDWGYHNMASLRLAGAHHICQKIDQLEDDIQFLLASHYDNQ